MPEAQPPLNRLLDLDWQTHTWGITALGGGWDLGCPSSQGLFLGAKLSFPFALPWHLGMPLCKLLPTSSDLQLGLRKGWTLLYSKGPRGALDVSMRTPDGPELVSGPATTLPGPRDLTSVVPACICKGSNFSHR